MIDETAKEQNNRVLVITLVLLIGFISSVIFHYIMGFYLKIPYPYNTFLFRPYDHFNDFFNVYNSVRLVRVTYFPFTQILIRFLTLLPKSFSFFVTMTLFLITLFYLNWFKTLSTIKNKFLKTELLIVLTMLSYPVLIALDRGNIEVILFIFLALFLYYYYFKKSYLWSVLFLSMAIAIKLFPAALLVLLISDKKYKEAVYCIITTIGLTISGYLLFGFVSGKGFLEAIKISLVHRQNYIYNYNIRMFSLPHSHSIWNLFSLIKLFYGRLINSNFLIITYSVIAILFFISISAYVIFIENVRWRKIALVIFAMISLPYSSADYTLIYLFFPIMFFVISKHSNKNSFIYALLFGLLLTPLDYYYFPINYRYFAYPSLAYIGPDVSISVFLYPLIIITFMTLIIVQAFKERQKGTLKIDNESL